MPRVAIFVDAGYLFAQGSTALTGSKKKRIETRLDKNAVLAELLAVAKEKADGASPLRIYWYDGALGYGGPTLEQEAIASSDNVKLRLGFINKAGQQKGVDSLIVTDLINLARNNAISDALLMSGDEDVRIGVEIAQGFGVRIHLLGIVPEAEAHSRSNCCLKPIQRSNGARTRYPSFLKSLSFRSPTLTMELLGRTAIPRVAVDLYWRTWSSDSSANSTRISFPN